MIQMVGGDSLEDDPLPRAIAEAELASNHSIRPPGTTEEESPDPRSVFGVNQPDDRPG